MKTKLPDELYQFPSESVGIDGNFYHSVAAVFK